MRYRSTRSSTGVTVSSAEVIARGIASDGGPYVRWSRFLACLSALRDLVSSDYSERALAVLRPC